MLKIFPQQFLPSLTEGDTVEFLRHVEEVHGELRMSVFKLDGGNLHRLLCAFWLISVTALRARARGRPLPAVEFNIQLGDSAFSLAPPRMQWLWRGT